MRVKPKDKLPLYYAPAMIAFVSLVLYGISTVVNYFYDPRYFHDSLAFTLYSLGFMVLYATVAGIIDFKPEYGVYVAGTATVLSVYAVYPGLLMMCWGGLISLAIWLFYFIKLAVENPRLYGYNWIWGAPRALPILTLAPGALQLAWSMMRTIYDEHRPPATDPALVATTIAVLPILALCYADRPGSRALRLIAIIAVAFFYTMLFLGIPLNGYQATGITGLFASITSLIKMGWDKSARRKRPWLYLNEK